MASNVSRTEDKHGCAFERFNSSQVMPLCACLVLCITSQVLANGKRLTQRVLRDGVPVASHGVRQLHARRERFAAARVFVGSGPGHLHPFHGVACGDIFHFRLANNGGGSGKRFGCICTRKPLGELMDGQLIVRRRANLLHMMLFERYQDQEFFFHEVPFLGWFSECAFAWTRRISVQFFADEW